MTGTASNTEFPVASAAPQTGSASGEASYLRRPPAPPQRQPSGLTLVELLVTMTIFLMLALFMFMAVREVVARWQAGERRRIIYETASGVLGVMASDIRCAVTEEPLGSTEVKALFIGGADPETHLQRLMLVRSFECGPERALTFNAGDPAASEAMFQPLPDPDNPNPPAKPSPPASKGATEVFDGSKAGSFKALGGMAMIGYRVKNHVLYRHVLAPVQGGARSFFGDLPPGSKPAQPLPEKGQPLAANVLYLGFDYWSQFTQAWEASGNGKTKIAGPEKIWDSTRGDIAPPFNKFILHRGSESHGDPQDDVFPQKVRITLTVDSPLPKCIFTKLSEDIGDDDTEIAVESTQGFGDGGENDFILIEDEWMKVARKTGESFKIAQRGARGTEACGHKAESVVRTGKTFRTVVYIPNYREDFTSDDSYFLRIGQTPGRGGNSR